MLTLLFLENIMIVNIPKNLGMKMCDFKTHTSLKMDSHKESQFIEMKQCRTLISPFENSGFENYTKSCCISWQMNLLELPLKWSLNNKVFKADEFYTVPNFQPNMTFEGKQISLFPYDTFIIRYHLLYFYRPYCGT